MGTHYARAETDRDEERKRDPVKCKLHDARRLATRKGLPKCHVMEQLQDHGRPNTRFVSNRTRGNFVADNVAVQCSEFIDLPVGIDNKTSFDLTELNILNQPDLTSFFTDHIVIDESESNSLEQRTVLQGESAEWLKQHQFRLTASNFGKVNSRIQRQIQKRLLAEKSLTWKTAVEMALAMEVADKQAKNFRNSPADGGIHRVRSPHPLKAIKPKRPCGRTQPVLYVDDDILQKEPNDNFKLFHLHQEKPEPSIMVPVKVNRVSHSMELDTGASVSIMSEEACRRRFPKVPLEESQIKLKTYTGEALEIIGQALVEVTY
ncbi:hypothetical protein pdam_00017639 [Pocillopora damicornis]|uniref:Peptidase A2 domain-containing protein n=1 Tax=Pocillopora damicornis TaxID=46731 RepID=A0A3M6U783_POCDA|nr:hypothetical protein pdam_00017639 [Pocillopora damicornis]